MGENWHQFWRLIRGRCAEMYKRWDNTATNLLYWFTWDIGYAATLKRIHDAFLPVTIERRWLILVGLSIIATVAGVVGLLFGILALVSSVYYVLTIAMIESAILSLTDANQAEVFWGDLYERRSHSKITIGIVRAELWMWRQIVVSVPPILWSALRSRIGQRV